jgi:hypothetical protein
MRVACWIKPHARKHIHKTTRQSSHTNPHARACMHARIHAHTHAQKYVSYCFSTATMLSRKRLKLTLCAHFQSCLNFFTDSLIGTVVLCSVTLMDKEFFSSLKHPGASGILLNGLNSTESGGWTKFWSSQSNSSLGWSV